MECVKRPWRVFRPEVVAAENSEAKFKAYAEAKGIADEANIWEGRANHWLLGFGPMPPGEWWHFPRQREWPGLWILAETLKATRSGGGF